MPKPKDDKPKDKGGNGTSAPQPQAVPPTVKGTTGQPGNSSPY
jgi:hypothetical protein